MKVQTLTRALDRISSQSFERGLVRGVAELALTFIQDEFEGEKDPYERAWKPLAYRRGKILEKTGTLRSSFTVAFGERSFTISNTASYAGFHQAGTKRMPKRRILPDLGVPRRWREGFNLFIDEKVSEALGEAR